MIVGYLGTLLNVRQIIGPNHWFQKKTKKKKNSFVPNNSTYIKSNDINKREVTRYMNEREFQGNCYIFITRGTTRCDLQWNLYGRSPLNNSHLPITVSLQYLCIQYPVFEHLSIAVSSLQQPLLCYHMSSCYREVAVLTNVRVASRI